MPTHAHAPASADAVATEHCIDIQLVCSQTNIRTGVVIAPGWPVFCTWYSSSNIYFATNATPLSASRCATRTAASLDRGLYCDTTPYANNTFESDPSARNGAKLHFGNSAGSCVNWKKMGGVSSNCCMVPRGTSSASHAPWCWVSETEYAYCWREDLGPYGFGWKSKDLKPLEQHFTCCSRGFRSFDFHPKP